MTCGKTSIGMFRLMNKNSDWIWVSGYGRVLYKNGKPDYVVTTNRIVRYINLFDFFNKLIEKFNFIELCYHYDKKKPLIFFIGTIVV